MSKEDILLRETVYPPLTTKGSEFIFTDLDGNFITIFNQLVALSQSSQVPAYSAAVTYKFGEYVSFNSQLWKMINGVPQINITPGTDPLTWLAVYASDLVQAPLIGGAKIYEFEVLIPSAQVLTMGVTDTPVEIIPALGVGLAPQILSGSVTVKNIGGFPYDINTDVLIMPSSFDVVSNESNFICNNVLQATVVQSLPLRSVGVAYQDFRSELPTNTNIIAAVKDGNPNGGVSDIIIKGTYTILDLN
jgi:hypothetical protein